MNKDESSRLGDFAEIVLALGRQLRPPNEVAQMGTAVEAIVMRFITLNPGTSARAASEATLLPPSNLSRVLRVLEKKGFVRREVDPGDARVVRLYPTVHARKNLQKLRAAWSRALRGTAENPETINFVTGALRRVEGELVARRRRAGGPASNGSS